MDELVTYAISGRLPVLREKTLGNVLWDDIGEESMNPNELVKIGQSLVRLMSKRNGVDDKGHVWVWNCVLIAKSVLYEKKSDFYAWYMDTVQVGSEVEIGLMLCGFIDTGELMRGLILNLTTLCPLIVKKKKDACITICGKYDWTLERILLHFRNQPTKDRKMELCVAIFESASKASQIIFLLKLVRLTARDIQWSAALLKLLEPSPSLTMLLLSEISSICDGNKQTKSARKLLLDCLVIASKNYFREEILCKAIEIAMTDSDATLRLASLKLLRQALTVHQEYFNQAHYQQIANLLITLIVQDSAKSVIYGSMEALVAVLNQSSSLIIPEGLSYHIICTFLLNKARNGTQISNEIPLRLLRLNKLLIDPSKLLLAYAQADEYQKKCLLDLYSYRRFSQSRDLMDVETQLSAILCEFDPLATSLNNADRIEEFLAKVVPQPETKPIWVGKLKMQLENSLLHYNEPNALSTCLLACAWSSLFSIDYQKQCAEAIIQLLYQFFQGDNLPSKHEQYVAAYSLRFLRRLQCSHFWAAKLEEIVYNILFCGPCQSELIRLWYQLPRAQERIYFILAEAQNSAFISKEYRNIQAFIRLIGIIAIENAHFVGHQYPQTKSPNLVDEDSSDEHYMDDFATEQQQKRAIQSEREKILNEGVLGAFLPFLESFLPHQDSSFTPPTDLTLTALASLGDFMKVSRVLSQKYNTWLVSIICDSLQTDALRKACLDIWASIQPTLQPSVEKSNGIKALELQLEQTDSMTAIILGILCRLILQGQLRSDQLRGICMTLLADDSAIQSLSSSFFYSFFRIHCKDACQRIYDIYFSMNEDPSRLEVIKKIVSIATTVGIQLEALHFSLIKDCEEQTRITDASAFLSILQPLACITVKLLSIVERYLFLQAPSFLYVVSSFCSLLRVFAATYTPISMRVFTSMHGVFVLTIAFSCYIPDSLLQAKLKSTLKLLAADSADQRIGATLPELHDLIGRTFGQ